MHSFKQGDILYSTWGYEQTNADFYLVLKTTPKTVTLQQLETSTDEIPGKMVGKTIPIKDKPTGKPLRRKVHNHHGDEFIVITNYEYAEKWDGKPIHTSSYG